MSSILQTQRSCPNCQELRLFTKSGTNHLAHALISIFLCGLWIPVWILVGASNASQPYRCSKCGAETPGSGFGFGLIGFAAVAIGLLIVWSSVARMFFHDFSPISHETISPGQERFPSPNRSDEILHIRQRQEAETATIRFEQQEAQATKKDEMAANTLRFYQDLADKGDSYGQYNLGLKYAKGDGVEKDWFKAVDYLSKAAAQGREDAKEELAKLLAERKAAQAGQ